MNIRRFSIAVLAALAIGLSVALGTWRPLLG